MRNVQQEVTDRILAEMQQGKLPWVQPWSGRGSNAMPRNAITKRAYSGANVVLLWLSPYASQDWITYKQAQELGGNVKKGEKGTHIIYASQVKGKDKETQEDKSFFMLKSYTVFNIEQCEGIDLNAQPVASINQDQRDRGCDAFMASTGADIRHGEGRAYYRQAGDYIMLPPYEMFKSGVGYYETALHELVHWTGAEARCNRQFGKRFGDRAYAAEELVAELGAAFMCAEFGYDAMTQHAAYIQNWIELLKDDPKAFITAASKASQAVEYLREVALNQDLPMAA